MEADNAWDMHGTEAEHNFQAVKGGWELAAGAKEAFKAYVLLIFVE